MNTTIATPIDPTLINGTTTDVDAIKAAFAALEADGFKTGFGHSLKQYKKAVYFPASRFNAFSSYENDLQYNLLIEVTRPEYTAEAVAAFEAQGLTVDVPTNDNTWFYVQPFMDFLTRGKIRNWMKCVAKVADYDTSVNEFAEASQELLLAEDPKTARDAASKCASRAYRVADLRYKVEDTVYGPNYTSIPVKTAAAMSLEAWLVLWDSEQD